MLWSEKSLLRLRAGLKLDYGKTYVKDGKTVMPLKLQANKNAHNATLKRLANQNPHGVWSYAEVEIEFEATGSNPETAAASSKATTQSSSTKPNPQPSNVEAQRAADENAALEEKGRKVFRDLILMQHNGQVHTD
ncbi:hypothetical protein P7C71_g5347, partial [Lecanoromycetidae sp. Uapishka_2]